MSLPRILQVGLRDVQWGERVTVVAPVNAYECVIGDDTFIGPFVEIQRGVKVGARCRIQSHAFVCELTEIGDDCFVGHGVMFVNDLFRGGGPARGDRTQWVANRIGAGVSIGSNATLLGVSVCDGSVIGAGAVVAREIDVRGVWAGVPARLIRRL
jgi:acetyltransferase-like isoleucine patch superfamily enzyme